MTAAARLRVLVIFGSEPIPEWHRDVVEQLHAVAEVRVGAQDAFDADDVVVDLGHRVREGLVAPSFGTWRYGFGDGAFAAEGATGTLARLYRTTKDPTRSTVLVEGWYRSASEDAPATGEVTGQISGWCARIVRQAAMGDMAALDASPVEIAGCAEPTPPTPSTTITERLRDEWRRWRRRERWTIGLVEASLADIMRRGAMPEPRWVIGTDSDRYLADPFPIAIAGDGVRVLAEEYQYRGGRGGLVALTIAHDGRIVDRSAILTQPHHLAYPFVLRDGDDTFCVPEMAATRSIRAYRVGESFEAHGTLIDGMAGVDPTLVRHDGRWWLFCTDRDRQNQTDLHLFYADDWRGPWQAHPMNPVKSDTRSSRPAGALFELDGRLFRPAQDCSRRYGGAIAINEVEQLSPSRFTEHVVVTLRPDPSWAWPDGMHTINAIGDVVVVDGLRVERG